MLNLAEQTDNLSAIRHHRADRSRETAKKTFSKYGGGDNSRSSRRERWRLPVYPPDYPLFASPPIAPAKTTRGGQVARFAIFAALLTWLIRLFPPRS